MPCSHTDTGPRGFASLHASRMPEGPASAHLPQGGSCQHSAPSSYRTLPLLRARAGYVGARELIGAPRRDGLGVAAEAAKLLGITFREVRLLAGRQLLQVEESIVLFLVHVVRDGTADVLEFVHELAARRVEVL